MSLRDELKKARLLSKQDTRRLAHEERVARKDKGREQLEQERQQHQEQLRAQQQQTAAMTAREQQAIEVQRQQLAEVAAVEAILQGALKPVPGPVKFYFEAADGSLPWLEVQPRQAQEIGSCMCCIVRPGPEGSRDYRLLDPGLTRRVAKVRPEAVVYAPRGLL